MKKLFLISIGLTIMIVNVFAQKKNSQSTADELALMKAREVEMQKQLDSLCAVNASNQVLIKNLGDLISAFSSLKDTYKTNSDDIKALVSKVEALNETVAAMSSSSPQPVDETPVESDEPKFDIVGDLCYGLALVKEGHLYGFVDKDNNYVIPAKFEEAGSFREGLARVKVNDKWGFIDKTGKYVIQPQFEETFDFGTDFYHNMTRVRINGKWGVINKTGGYVVSAKYGSIWVPMDSNLCIWYLSSPNERKVWCLYKDGTIEEY